MEQVKREDVIPVVSRHIGDAFSNTVFGTSAPRVKWCDYHQAFEPIVNFYVRSDRQHIKREHLKESDFRNVCIEIWDQMTKNQRNGFGWLTDREVLEKQNSNTIEKFLTDEVTVNE
jgi:hypothetical protein